MSRQKKLFGFIALAIAMFIGTLDSTIINIALPDIMDYFKASLNDTSWISTIYVMGLSVCMIPASKLADQFGRKKVMLTGLILFGTSSALCALSGSLFILIAMRLFQGIGGAMITPIVIPMAIELSGRKKTQKVAGAVGAVTALAAAGGPPIGGMLIKYISWQAIFYVNVPFALISFILTIFFIKESYDKTISKSIDWFGMLFLSTALFLLTFSLLKGRDYGWHSTLIVSMFIGSAVSFILFLFTEIKVKAPLVELQLFKEYTFTASCICYLITGFGIISPLLIFNYFLQNALGYQALNAAYIVMAVSLTVIISMPLGSLITDQFGARLVNFCGVLFMGIGAFMLSKITYDSPKQVMIADMVVCGFGLGFSCQSMVSSIKHLPKEKSGIGSGIVNAARQIGTCIGIALLVSVLNTNVTDAKKDIVNHAEVTINQSEIVNPVKAVMIRDIRKSFNSSDNNTNKQQKKMQKRITKDVKQTLSSTPSTKNTSDNEILVKLYNGASTLRKGAGKAADGQNNLNAGIKKLNTGMVKLTAANSKFTNGLNKLDSSISKIADGSGKLAMASNQGVSILSSGIDKLDKGGQKLLSQFSSGKNNGKQTMYDAINRVADGSQTLSANLGTYISAVNNTYYLMIKSNPASIQLLASYRAGLLKAQSMYAAAQDKSLKQQYKLQIQALSNLVVLYTAGTDSSVSSEQQFEEKLLSLAKQKNNQNVVAAGYQVKIGSRKLTNGSKKAAAQFGDTGEFRNGVAKVVNGISQMEKSKSRLNQITNGINKLSASMSKLHNGSNKLLSNSKKMNDGLTTVKNGSDKLLTGSARLMHANCKIKAGTAKLLSGVGTIGQQTEIKDVMNKVKKDKNDKIAGAFRKTFLFSSIIMILASFCGFFTDKKSRIEN